MSYGIVYLALSRTSQKGYVGQTTQGIEARWRAHRYGGCHALRAAIQKYGADDFDLVPLALADDAVSLDRLEQDWIKKLNTTSPGGYNLKEGGANGKPTEQVRQRTSAAHQGVPLSESHRLSMGVAQQLRREYEAQHGIGPVFTQASLEAMRLAKLGTTHSVNTRDKMSLSRAGYIPSVETREKLRLAATGRSLSPEARDKIQEAKTGRKHSEATKALMSQSRKGTERPPEVMAKTAAKNRGQKRTPEQKVRMRQARLVYLARKQETA